MRITSVLLCVVMGWAVGLVRAAERRELWLYYATNLQVEQNVDRLEPIWRRAAAAGYTKVLLADSKFSRLAEVPEHYWRNVARVRKLAAELKLQIVPTVFQIGYSNDLLWHDPNLAEGLPVKDALFVVKGNEARVVADPPVALKPKPDWLDDSVKLGADGVATVASNPGNARLVFKLAVSPFRCYHVAVRVRTDGYTGTPEVKAIAGGQSLQFANVGVKRTQEWTEHHAVFNSLDHREVSVYFGTWGAAKGTLQWKDWRIEEVGLLNVLRRPGTPLKVGGLVEGKDYEPVVDPRMGTVPWKGSYEVWHEPPVLRTRNVPDGTRLRVSWYHPPTVYDGQVAACLSDPKLTPLLADQARRVKDAFGATALMMSHDELRCANWDEACQSRHLSAGQLFAENARTCTRLLAGSDVYVWSDMFDPHHNAHKDYYLVRGDLAGSWEGLDRSVTVVNWNFGKRDASLAFFAGRGHRQVIAGYYDADVSRITQWLTAADKVDGVAGVMYTTWQNRYDDLEAFARLVNARR